MADVFLSYKREDRGRAKEIAEAIEKHGYTVFFDAEIDVGEAWNARIERELNAAKCVGVLWSGRSTDAVIGEWVHNEARKGKARQILAPAMIADCEIPLEFSSVQAADLRAWRGDVSEVEWQRFINRIGECVKRPPQKLRAQPWRRRWVRLAAVMVLLVGATAALMWFRPWAQAPSSQQTAGGAPSGPTPTAGATGLPSDVWQMLNWSIEAGDCAGLQQDINTVRSQYPGVVQFEQGMIRQCQRRAPVVAAAPAPSTSSATGSTSTQTTSPTPAPSEPERPRRDTGAPAPSANFLAGLARGDRSTFNRSDLESIARRYEVSADIVQAVVEVEGRPEGSFSADGLPVILFEPHIFSRLTQRRFDASNPNVSYAAWDRTRYPRTQEGRWEQLREAYALDPENALAAASWGRFQIMGMNHARANFDSPSAFVGFLAQSDVNNVEAMMRFIRNNNLLDELQRQDWEGFARGYNGPGQVERYGRLLREAHARAAGSASGN